MSNDRVADFLTRLRNAQKAQLANLTCPASQLLADICKVLKEEGYIVDFRVETKGAKKDLVVELKYHEGEAAIKEITRISKSGQRKYTQVAKMPKHYSGLGIAILSTSKGVMSDFAARQQNVGGEILCTVF
jgi:small subunit ribosomal protein S8